MVVKSFQTLNDVDVAHKTVLVRADLNVPMQEGRVTDTTRIDRLLPTLKGLQNHQAKIVVLSHFGRPKGQKSEKDSLKQVVPTLSERLGWPVLFAPDCVGGVAETAVKALHPGQALLLENLRFHEEEEKNDPTFAKALASLGDLYVNDAFSCSHRAHASVVGITRFLPAVAGRGMQAELEALHQVLEAPKRPLMAIVAGSKVSTKLALLENLLSKVDHLVIGGGMANTFLKATGHPIGQSLYETDMLDTARHIWEKAKASGCNLVLPQDVAITPEIKPQDERRVVLVPEVHALDRIADIGDITVHYIQSLLRDCATVIWNGPVGIFEISPFDRGSTAIAQNIADLTDQGQLTSVAGGGDTLAALAHAGCANRFTYTSTAGGAFLEWLEGKNLPGVEALTARAVQKQS